MPKYKLGYSGALIKTLDTCVGIQKQAAEKLKKEGIFIGFDKDDLSISFLEKKILQKIILKK